MTVCVCGIAWISRADTVPDVGQFLKKILPYSYVCHKAVCTNISCPYLYFVSLAHNSHFRLLFHAAEAAWKLTMAIYPAEC